MRPAAFLKVRQWEKYESCRCAGAWSRFPKLNKTLNRIQASRSAGLTRELVSAKVEVTSVYPSAIVAHRGSRKRLFRTLRMDLGRNDEAIQKSDAERQRTTLGTNLKISKPERPQKPEDNMDKLKLNSNEHTAHN